MNVLCARPPAGRVAGTTGRQIGLPTGRTVEQAVRTRFGFPIDVSVPFRAQKTSTEEKKADKCCSLFLFFLPVVRIVRTDCPLGT